jgi:RNA recognition motif-containing protein
LVRNLPLSWSGADIAGNFHDQRIIKINFIKNKLGKKTGKAILHYRSDREAETAIKHHHGREVEDGHLHFELFKGKMEVPVEKRIVQHDKSHKEALQKRVYIQNISPKATKDDIYALTQDLTELQEIKMPVDAGGDHKGFAIIYLSDPTHAPNLINFLHNK